MAGWHPGSVYASLIARSNWISTLNISDAAKRLTRLKGRDFQNAVERILDGTDTRHPINIGASQ